MNTSRLCYLRVVVIQLNILVCFSGLAQWNTVSGGIHGTIRDISVSEDSASLIVGGMFVYLGNDSLRANHVAFWDVQNQDWDTTGYMNGSGDTTTTGTGSQVFRSLEYHDTTFVTWSGHEWQYQGNDKYALFLANGEWKEMFQPNGQPQIHKSNDRLFVSHLGDTSIDTDKLNFYLTENNHLVILNPNARNTVLIFDSRGKLVFNDNSSKSVIDLNHLALGYYLVRTENGIGRILIH